MPKNKQPLFIRLWGRPFLLFILTLAGLIICLVKEDLWDLLSWILLAIPLVLIVRYYCWQKKQE